MHPWFVQHRRTHDPNEWFDVERQMLPNEKRIEEKPWGCEIIWAHTPEYTGKVLIIDGNKRLSRQYHDKKTESFMVTWGSMVLEIGMPGTDEFQRIEMHPGDTYHCPHGRVHRMCAGPIGVHVTEISTGDPYDVDVVRLEDDYGRK